MLSKSCGVITLYKAHIECFSTLGLSYKYTDSNITSTSAHHCSIANPLVASRHAACSALSQGTPKPIASFSSNSFCFLSFSSLFNCRRYSILSLRAFSSSSPNGSNLSDAGSLNGFLIQLPRSVNVVLLGRPLNWSYALFKGGSANGLGVACGFGIGVKVAIGAG
jgi:hypothetical protein